jgi:hypothetical protein
VLVQHPNMCQIPAQILLIETIFLLDKSTNSLIEITFFLLNLPLQKRSAKHGLCRKTPLLLCQTFSKTIVVIFRALLGDDICKRLMQTILP